MSGVIDIIRKKRDGLGLSPEEIQFVISGIVSGAIPDYQASAFLMAAFIKGFSHDETLALTRAYMHSGDIIDLSEIPGVKVDKHSTGGVGDDYNRLGTIGCGSRMQCGQDIGQRHGPYRRDS